MPSRSLQCRTRSHNRDRCLLWPRWCQGDYRTLGLFNEIGCLAQLSKLRLVNETSASGYTYALYTPLGAIFMLTIIFVPLMLYSLCSGFAFSLVFLYLGARMRPIIGKNNLICFLGIGLFVFLWIALILPLFNISVSANNLEDFPRLLLFLFLLGFTPSAALPSLILYGPGKDSLRRKH